MSFPSQCTSAPLAAGRLSLINLARIRLDERWQFEAGQRSI
jgi:hypothetical protein